MYIGHYPESAVCAGLSWVILLLLSGVTQESVVSCWVSRAAQPAYFLTVNWDNGDSWTVGVSSSSRLCQAYANSDSVVSRGRMETHGNS